jgi:hypothetical protein
MGWKECLDDREKYQLYLCSREWSEKREAIRRRSKGVCERCHHNDMDAVHHLTYARKYRESLDDLQAICNECHAFTHGKSNFDPVLAAPAFLFGKEIGSFYLAGKISGDSWRDEIVDGWSNEDSRNYAYSGVFDDHYGGPWKAVLSAAEAYCGKRLDYVGPWWSDLGSYGGHALSQDCTMPHAYGTEPECEEGRAIAREVQATVASNVVAAVQSCDLLFAWINSDDCLGTMFEIGVAVRSSKTVVIASPPAFSTKETWLCRHFAGQAVGKSAGEAWKNLWDYAEKNQ